MPARGQQGGRLNPNPAVNRSTAASRRALRADRGCKALDHVAHERGPEVERAESFRSGSTVQQSRMDAGDGDFTRATGSHSRSPPSCRRSPNRSRSRPTSRPPCRTRMHGTLPRPGAGQPRLRAARAGAVRVPAGGARGAGPGLRQRRVHPAPGRTHHGPDRGGGSPCALRRAAAGQRGGTRTLPPGPGGGDRHGLPGPASWPRRPGLVGGRALPPGPRAGAGHLPPTAAPGRPPRVHRRRLAGGRSTGRGTCGVPQRRSYDGYGGRRADGGRSRGVRTLGPLALPEEAWWEAFYAPMLARIEALRAREAGLPDRLAELDRIAGEPAMHRWHDATSGDEFFVARPA